VRSYNGTAYSAYASANATTDVASGTIVWSGDFDDGDLLKWNHYDPNPIEIFGTPRYGGPAGDVGQNSLWFGNGDRRWLTAGTAGGAFKVGPRLNQHAIGMRVKSTAGGSVNATSTDPSVVGDYDGSVTTRRRTELRGMTLLWNNNYIPKETTRWVSCSIYIPSDWDNSGSGWGPILLQFKSTPGSDMTPPVAIENGGGVWRFRVLRSNNLDQGGTSPSVDWPGGLVFSPSLTSSPFYPNNAASVAALSNLNKGDWTHFMLKLHFDGRKSTEGGVGFVRLWMRAGSGSWVEVVHVVPDASYGVTHPQSATGRWGFQASLYMDNNQVLGLAGPGRTLYYDNIKIGDEDCSFSQMSHDGSEP
jgi:hypothetical protein